MSRVVGGVVGDVGPDPRAVRAAAANAAWCEAVCRVHGIPGSVADGSWRAGGHPPPYYPDVVTLRPGLPAAAVADAVAARAGAAVKDSFADVDLADLGFEVLFEAQWVWRSATPPAAPAAGVEWVDVVDDEALAEWGADSDQPGTFLPELLADPAVRFLTAVSDGEVVGRAALCAADGVVGLSNVFPGARQVWDTIGAAVGRRFPAHPLAGYERGADLAAALAAGFEPVGRLRVWVRR